MGFLKGVALATVLTSAGVGASQRRDHLQLQGPVTNCDLGPHIECRQNATHILYSSQDKQTMMVKGPNGYTVEAEHEHPLGNQPSPPPVAPAQPGTQPPPEVPAPARPETQAPARPGTPSPPEGTPFFPIWLTPVLSIIACGAGVGASSIACGIVLPYLETRWLRQSTSGVPLAAITINPTPTAPPTYDGISRGVLVQSSQQASQQNLSAQLVYSTQNEAPVISFSPQQINPELVASSAAEQQPPQRTQQRVAVEAVASSFRQP